MHHFCSKYRNCLIMKNAVECSYKGQVTYCWGKAPHGHRLHTCVFKENHQWIEKQATGASNSGCEQKNEITMSPPPTITHGFNNIVISVWKDEENNLLNCLRHFSPLQIRMKYFATEKPIKSEVINFWRNSYCGHSDWNISKFPCHIKSANLLLNICEAFATYWTMMSLRPNRGKVIWIQMRPSLSLGMMRIWSKYSIIF